MVHCGAAKRERCGRRPPSLSRRRHAACLSQRRLCSTCSLAPAPPPPPGRAPLPWRPLPRRGRSGARRPRAARPHACRGWCRARAAVRLRGARARARRGGRGAFAPWVGAGDGAARSARCARLVSAPCLYVAPCQRGKQATEAAENGAAGSASESPGSIAIEPAPSEIKEVLRNQRGALRLRPGGPRRRSNRVARRRVYIVVSATSTLTMGYCTQPRTSAHRQRRPCRSSSPAHSPTVACRLRCQAAPGAPCARR